MQDTKDEMAAIQAKLAAKRALKNPEEEQARLIQEEERRLAEEKRKKEEQERRERDESRARLAAKAALWK